MRKINLLDRKKVTSDDLKQVKDDLTPKMKKRIQAIMFIMQGRQVKQFAQFMELTEHMARRHVQNFIKGGSDSY